MKSKYFLAIILAALIASAGAEDKKTGQNQNGGGRPVPGDRNPQANPNRDKHLPYDVKGDGSGTTKTPVTPQTPDSRKGKPLAE